MSKIRNKIKDIINIIIPIIILAIPITISMIISKVNIVKIIVIEFIVYIIAYSIKQKVNKKIKIKPTFNQQYYRDIPQVKPALLLYYLKRNQYYIRSDFYGTILDLVNRNIFVLNKSSDGSSYKITVNTERSLDNLNKFEKNIINLLFDDSNRTEVNFSDLKRRAEEDSLFQYKIDAWKMYVELEAKENEYEIKNKKIIVLKKISSILLILSCAMSYLLLLFQGNINEYIYIAIIGITIVLAEITNIEETSFTQDIVDEIEKGKALKRYLEDYSLIDKKEIEHIKLWEGFLVYAIILDSASNVKKFFDNIFK